MHRIFGPNFIPESQCLVFLEYFDVEHAEFREQEDR